MAGGSKQNGKENRIFHQRSKSVIRRKKGVNPGQQVDALPLDLLRREGNSNFIPAIPLVTSRPRWARVSFQKRQKKFRVTWERKLWDNHVYRVVPFSRLPPSAPRRSLPHLM
jgi:hypothetical protein